MIDSVKFEGYYANANEVPRIGQRKWMRLNGSKQLMTLNHIEAKRRRTTEWNDKTDREQVVIEFTTEEIWGTYY